MSIIKAMTFMSIFELIAGIIALIILEIVLGIDNLVFLSILTEKLPKPLRKKARRWGLTFAWVTRLMLLASAVWLAKLTKPLLVWQQLSFSARDLFLFAGGAFLIAKATQEIHFEVAETKAEQKNIRLAPATFHAVVIQVGLMDIIFSLDSVLTAVGLTNNFMVMAIAITVAILVMLFASEPVSDFIETHPSIKMLALCFLILIGMLLVADSFSFHVPRGYLYFAMGFSLGVESLNLLRQARRRKAMQKQ